MKEVEYQIKNINKLVDTSNEYLTDEDREGSTIIFKAPTGSGKTFMVSQTITRIVKENPTIEFSFIWISVNSLHEQSLNNLSRYFEDERLLECLAHTELNNNSIEQNEIMFINWESINKENSLFRVDNEQNWNLQNVIENTKEEGRTIVLLIDESHRNAKTDKSKALIEIISPKLVIEITATPNHLGGHLIDIPLQTVIKEGMIKKEIQINSAKENQVKNNKDLLLVALKKRNQLKNAYESLGIDINPLLLIQIPNKKANDSINPEDEIIEILNKENISTQNKKLAIWLSENDKKVNLVDVERGNNEVEVLIFKEAIALGWDCPRASILFLQREWNQDRYDFNIQTLGRIMRMPQQKHYDEKPELNIGYVFSASDNFSVVEDLAKDYTSEQKLIIDNDIYNKKPKLTSEFIRRKRELTRLSAEFKKVFFEASDEFKLQDNINSRVDKISKTIKLDGSVKEIDKEQIVEFENSKTILKSISEIQGSYNRFCSQMASGYEISRSQNIIKSTIRAWFKDKLNIGDEDIIQLVVMSTSNKNNSQFKQVIERAKELYANLPTKTDEIVPNENWEVPSEINIFSEYEEVIPSKKSILKNEEKPVLMVRKNKNGLSELSKPEKDFITDLENTDDYVNWWYYNGISESKYFSIAYKKEDGFLYAFYPDFKKKKKKETIIIEIKDDKDFKADNYYKLLAGKDYIKRYPTEEKTYFYILSPNDYFEFFKRLRDLDIENFSATFESRLTKYIKSQQNVIKNKLENNEKLSKIEQEYEELFSEYETSISKLENESLKRELAELELEESKKIINEYKTNIEVLSKNVSIKEEKIENIQFDIPNPFNICVLGEVTNEAEIRKELNKFFEKLGVDINNWDIEFFNNKKMESSNVLRGLVKNQTKFNLILTGQIHHHNNKGNTKGNLISELNNEKYVAHKISSNPKDKLTSDKAISSINEYINETNNIKKID
mgnify:FL=1